MRYNAKILAVSAILAAAMALSACGSSAGSEGSTVSSAASSPASSAAASSEAASPTEDILPLATGKLEDMKNGSHKFAAKILEVKDGQMTMGVYSYDAYTKEDIDGLQVGDVIEVHDQGDTTVTKMTVESLENNADTGYVTINGGTEEGGLDLAMDHDVYRTLTFDDYPVYYEVGELTLPLSENVTLSDSSADVQASPVESEGVNAVTEAIGTEPDSWYCNNTTVFTQDGVITNINRIWVP